LLSTENDPKVKRLAAKFDRVLVDAPCSGLGTLRRNPDLKYRQSPESLVELNLKQVAILASAARLVRPGGRLVYATCSILPEENEAVVKDFLAKHSDFRVLTVQGILDDAKISLTMPTDFLQLYPHQHATDGFFAAVMIRQLSLTESD
ncbi:MAG: RsmB/NOP family class I SAM-dependent RNA methyltransferase, partial [Neisseriaceae bacterium]|nr:RsmB/NOP family class I SAM-dependent RNA methyltransferase [Neisseriaceae bacterium]